MRSTPFLTLASLLATTSAYIVLPPELASSLGRPTTAHQRPELSPQAPGHQIVLGGGEGGPVRDDSIWDGYEVVRVRVDGVEERDSVRDIAKLLHLDVWSSTPTHIDLLLPPSFALSALAQYSPSPITTIVPSVSDLLVSPLSSSDASSSSSSHHKDKKKKKKPKKSRPEPIPPWDPSAPEYLTNGTRSPFYTAYHPSAEVKPFLNALAEEWPELARVETVGHSAEGREIWALKVGKPPQEGDGLRASLQKDGKKRKLSHKLGLVIAANQHAREWISTSTALYLAHTLLLGANKTTSSSELSRKDAELILNTFDITFVPVTNPDGYDYTFTTNRLWRKNRQVADPESGCVGTDLNRNWGYQWSPGQLGPCSESFPGSSPFSAPETAALADVLRSTEHLTGFIDLHSYGQMILWPYAYSCDALPAAEEDLHEGALGAAKAGSKVHKKPFKVGSVCEVTYTESGDALDWAYAEAGAKWSYSIELRDTGIHGFLLPASEILPTGEEATALFVDLARFIRIKAIQPY